MKKLDKLIAEAATAARAGLFDMAEKTYRKVLARDPSHLDGHYLLGTLLAERRDFAAAEQHLQIAAGLNPRSPYVWSNLGSLRRLVGDLDGALDAWGRATKINPKMAEAWFGIGQIHMSQNDFAGAERCMRTVLDIQPLAPAWSVLAQALDKQGRGAEALACCKGALALQPDNGSAAFLLARLEGRPMDYPPGDVIRTLFDGYAGNFERHLTEDLAYDVPRQIAQIIARQAGGRRFARAADLGCGTGLMRQALDHVEECVGVDLSPNMLDQARRKNIYTRLVEADLIEFLATESADFDLILATDVLSYMGPLEALFRAAFRSASATAWFAFSIELSAGEDWSLQPSGRYRHSRDFVRRAAGAAGWSVCVDVDQRIRLESNAPVAGSIFVLVKP